MTLEQRAKGFLLRDFTNIDGWIEDGWLTRMANFTRQETADLRTRLDEAEKVLLSAQYCTCGLLSCDACEQELRDYNTRYPREQTP